MYSRQTEISPSVFMKMVIAAYEILEAEKDYINSLNVFPVPDGDTGTNMFLTMKAAADAIKNKPCSTLPELSELVANECLLGARGNSGMILANFFKGFAKTSKFFDKLDINSLAKAISEGAQSAYQAVRNPVEGTILTVMNAVAKKVKEFSPKDSLASFFEKILETAEQVQKRTPELLPQLKRAGVVDAGGQGFVSILKAFTYVIKGKKIKFSKNKEISSPNLNDYIYNATLNHNFSLEFFLEGKNIEIEKLSSSLSRLGNSLVISKIGDKARVHIHTNFPEEVKKLASSYGELNLVCEDDMLAQHKSFLAQNKIGIVAVSPGEGITKIFIENGADSVITFSKSKPSVEELIKACESIDFQYIILLPNDNDILPTALQASKLIPKNVEVLPTKSVPEGIASLLSFDPENSFTDNLKLMGEISKRVKSGKIAQAVRRSKTSELSVKRKDYIGIYNDQIKAKAKNLREALLKLLLEIVKPEDEVIMICLGKGIKEREIKEIKSFISNSFKDKEIQWYYGGQFYYYLIIGVY